MYRCYDKTRWGDAVQIRSVVLGFLKVGVIGFGGGSALIPVVDKEIVKTRKLLSQDVFQEHVIVANITPGALPVKLGAAAGEKIAGPMGALAGALSVAFPGTFLSLLLVSVINILPGGALTQIEFASVGILSFILILLTKYISSVWRTSKQEGIGALCVLVTLLSCFFSAGKELQLLIKSFGPDISLPFDLSAINILALAFFAIFVLSGREKPLRIVVVTITGVLYIACMSGLVQNKYLRLAICAIMLISATSSMIQSLRSESAGGKIDFRAIVTRILMFIGPPLVLGAMAIAVGWIDPKFLANAFLSTVTSFGGGEAYLTVADDVFVGGGYISKEILYTQILPVVNALPGPILIKILAAVGFYVGGAHGGLFPGFCTGFICFLAGIGASCAVFVLVYEIFKSFSALKIFHSLKSLIQPVICGLLLSTMLSIMESMLRTYSSVSPASLFSLLIIGGLILAGVFIGKRFSSIICILVQGGLSLLVCNLLAYLF